MRSDRVFNLILRGLAVAIIAGFLGLTWFLWKSALPTLKVAGAGFVWSQAWDPVANEFGALPFLWGTVVSSLLALCFSAPVSIGAALFLTDIASKKIRSPIAFLIEMLAAIPSVVYGIWGIFVLAPLVREYIHPMLNSHLGFLPFFEGPPFGLGMLTAAMVLAAMILGLGRALGETMAVTMVIGNRPEISLSLFKPAATMASVIANEYAEAQGDSHMSALAAIGLVLLLVSSIVNLAARWIIKRTESKTHV